VLALRQLGLPLDKIREVMAGPASVAKVLAVHHGFLTAQLASVRVLRARVGALASTMSQSAKPVEDFLELIQKVIAMDETVTKYFTEDQLADWPIGVSSSARMPSPRPRRAGPSCSRRWLGRSSRGWTRPRRRRR